MIDVKSLRIGNIIKDHNGNLREVAYITECVGLKNDIGGIDKYQKEPIFSFDIETLRYAELTEELLLKCGFEIRSKNEDGIIYGKQNFTIIYGRTIFDDYAFFLNGYHNDCWIDTLHKLQNVFYILRNEELQINL